MRTPGVRRGRLAVALHTQLRRILLILGVALLSTIEVESVKSMLTTSALHALVLESAVPALIAA